MTIDTESLKKLVLNSLKDMKAKEIECIDIRGLSCMADYMIIASGTSNRHIKSTAENVCEQSKKVGIIPGLEGREASEWVLVDLGDVIVHIMLPDTRTFYAIEKLWAMSPDEKENHTA